MIVLLRSLDPVSPAGGSALPTVDNTPTPSPTPQQPESVQVLAALLDEIRTLRETQKSQQQALTALIANRPSDQVQPHSPPSKDAHAVSHDASETVVVEASSDAVVGSELNNVSVGDVESAQSQDYLEESGGRHDTQAQDAPVSNDPDI